MYLAAPCSRNRPPRPSGAGPAARAQFATAEGSGKLLKQRSPLQISMLESFVAWRRVYTILVLNRDYAQNPCNAGVTSELGWHRILRNLPTSRTGIEASPGVSAIDFLEQ